MIVNRESDIKGETANIKFYGLIPAIRGEQGYALEQRFLLPPCRAASPCAASLGAAVPHRAVPAPGTPGCAQGCGSSTGGHTWLCGRLSPLPGARQEEGAAAAAACQPSRCLISHGCAAAQLCPGPPASGSRRSC